jgi:hypothetical protein
MTSAAQRCASCEKELPPAWAIDGTPRAITGRICDDCFVHFNARSGMPLRDFLDGIAAPVLLISSNATITYANKTAQLFLMKDPSRIEGFRGGDVFECAYANLPEGCGQTIHCSGCTVRRAVTETFLTGRSLREVPAYLNQQISARCNYLDLHISTEKAWNMVLLRIDDTKPAKEPPRGGN